MKELSDYDKARQAADEIDEHIIEVLKSGRSFKVEAGAGSGKTYSLKKVIDWLQLNRGLVYKAKKKQIACITYTNAAVDVLKARLSEDSPIIPSTIHAFAWKNIAHYQSALIELIKNHHLLPDNCCSKDILTVKYDLGIKLFKDGNLYLYHDDVIKLFAILLGTPKFSRIFADNFPIVLIDEYQDSSKLIIDSFLNNFVEKERGPQFGFFGDAWQTIYGRSGACGQIDSSSFEIIKKRSNFRSQKCIVEVLNKIRPELPQISAINDHDGRVTVITTDEFTGQRQTNNYYKGELQPELLEEVIKKVQEQLFQNDGWQKQHTKVLMITHRVLSHQQGYDRLLEILDQRLKDMSDPHLLFFKDRIEPIYTALQENNSQLLFEGLGIRRQPVNNKSQKKKWISFKQNLSEARAKKIYDVVSCAFDSKLIPLPDEVEKIISGYPANQSDPYGRATIRDFYELPYEEVLNALTFFSADSLYSTDHGVKGEEYESVLFVIGRGWRDYNFDEILAKEPNNLSEKEQASYIMARNLFYVCCSRPQKNLALLITVPLNSEFKNYLERIFKPENIVSYRQFTGQ